MVCGWFRLDVRPTYNVGDIILLDSGVLLRHSILRYHASRMSGRCAWAEAPPLLTYAFGEQSASLVPCDELHRW